VTLDGLRADLCGAGRWGFGLVAVGQGLAGYAILTRLLQVQFGRRGMDLHHLFVRPDRRGQGVGALLLRAAEGRARALGAGWVTVSTHPDNLAAQAFYRAQGYDPMASVAPRFVRWL
jgi:GNAT superfamily N-acetyltransferase